MENDKDSVFTVSFLDGILVNLYHLCDVQHGG